MTQLAACLNAFGSKSTAACASATFEPSGSMGTSFASFALLRTHCDRAEVALGEWRRTPQLCRVTMVEMPLGLNLSLCAVVNPLPPLHDRLRSSAPFWGGRGVSTLAKTNLHCPARRH